MRKFAMAAIGLMMSGGVAWGQGAATQSVVLSADVGGYCTIDGSAIGAGRSATVATSNGKVTSPNADLALSGQSSKVICTSNARIQLTTTSGGLTNGSTPTDPNYVNKIHYTATANYNSQTDTLNTATNSTADYTTTGVATTGATTNVDLTVTVKPHATPDGKFLVNGTYMDTLRITLTPGT